MEPPTWTLSFPPPAPPLTLGGGGPPRVMGIVNVTPDSFSDGGAFLDPAAAADHALHLLAEGADIVDVGGESTRPGAEATPEQTQIARVVPVLRALRSRGVTAPLSVDTRRAAVAAAALDAGASMVNDVSGLRHDPAMAPLIARTGAPVVVMHMRGAPRDMQERIEWHDLIADVLLDLRAALGLATGAGVRENQLLIDPGIGFGKSVDDNLVLIGRLREFRVLGPPIVLGVSRKSFIAKTVGGDDPRDRLEGTLAAQIMGMLAGAALIRCHDVRAAVRSLRIAHLIAGAGNWPPQQPSGP
ncbi:MAG: dihydropteroate synthase [Planctomycetes bacterium]|nr:dihydropteroate synthase [Planctomycetota bacterium]